MITGRLEDWVIDPVFDIVWGHCYDDSKGRFRDGTYIHTSSVPDLRKKALQKGDLVKTLNSTYLLGDPL